MTTEIDDIMKTLFNRYLVSAMDHGWDWEDSKDLEAKFKTWVEMELELWCDDPGICDGLFDETFEEGGRFVK